MRRLPLYLSLAVALTVAPSHAAQFTYHGDLLDGDAPAQGRYDLRVRTFAQPDAKAALGAAVELPSVQVVDGGFAVELDLPEAKIGDTYVEVAVRKADSNDAFEVLGATQKLAKANNGCWALDGNTGLAAGSFLGNADPASTAPLVLRAKNSAIATLTPRGSVSQFGDAPSILFGSAANVANQTGATVSGGGATIDGIGAPCPTCRNQATSQFATVSGGIANLASGGSSTVGGGSTNTASGGDATVGGGSDNTASASFSTVGGGYDNDVTEAYGTVAGGNHGRASATASTVSGGAFGRAEANFASVVGGYRGLALGHSSTVAGGYENLAGSDRSFAGGHGARVRIPGAVPAVLPEDVEAADYTGAGGNDAGTFVWSDNQFTSFRSSGPKQFLVRAGGGVGLNTNAIGALDDVAIGARGGFDADTGLSLRSLAGKEGSIRVSDSSGETELRSGQGHLYLATSAGSKYIHTNDRLGVKRLPAANDLEVEGSASKATPGDWVANSDGRIKRAIAPIDDALATIQRLRPVTYAYTPEYLAQHDRIDDRRYYNVIAQEFAEVFPHAVHGSGEYLPGMAKSKANEILQVDTWPAQVTAIAAIQELAVHDDTLRDELAVMKRENASLRAELDAVMARLSRLESRQER